MTLHAGSSIRAFARLHANQDLIGAQRLRTNPSSKLSLFFVLILLCRLFIPGSVQASVSPTETSSNALTEVRTPPTLAWNVANTQLSLLDSPAFGVVKAIPRNAVTPSYTPEMANCDRLLASIFGGPGAVAAANGFEPAGLANQYPIYRGDIVGDDGVRRRGHLSYAMHLYGSPNGTADTALYVPIGFASHSNQPTPTDAAVTFYYPHLGNLDNVTVAVFHVANFAISYEGGRVRVGSIGGRGGSYAYYKHSHIEFYRGNTGLPRGGARENLRIDPAAVFGITSARLRIASK